MKGQKSTPQNVNQFGAGKQANTPKTIHVGTAPLVDVMFDQLEYLVAHNESHRCPPRCTDCARLRHVKRSLLRPFRSAVWGQAEPHTADV